MHQFESTLKDVSHDVRSIITFLKKHTEDGNFIFSFYDIPTEHWGRISQCDFPMEIIADLHDHEIEKNLPEELKGFYFRGDKVILTYPYEFEQLLRSNVEVEDVAVIIDGSIMDAKRMEQVLQLFGFFEKSLHLLSDYTFTFWIERFTKELQPPTDGTTTIAIDLDGVTPTIVVELEAHNHHLQEVIETHPFRKHFEESTGIQLRVYHRAAALLKRLKKESKT